MTLLPQQPSQNDNSQSNNGYDSSKEPILTVLNAEIESIRNTESRQGWTSWGLIAGIAAILWLILDELKTNIFQPNQVAIIVIVFFTIFDALRCFAILLSRLGNQNSESVRFRWSNESLSSNRFLFVFEILRSFLIIFTAFYWAVGWWLPLTLITAAYGWFLIIMLLSFISVFNDYAYEEEINKKGQIALLVFAILCFVSFCLYLQFVSPPFGDVIPNYKLGGLIAVGSYLIFWLLIVTKDSPILENLIRIRRNIAFNQMDVKAAIREADIALYGMQFGDAVMKEINSIFQLVERANQTTDSLIFQIKTMQSNLPNVKDNEEVIKAKIDLLISYRKTCESILRDRASTLEKMNSEFESLMNRRNRLIRNITSAENFFAQIDVTMNTITKDADDKFAVYLKLEAEYDAKLNQFDNAKNKPLPQ